MLEPIDEAFTSALSVLSHLRDRGDLLVSLSPPYSISIEIERTVLGPHLNRASVSEADVRSAASQASDILRALLEDMVDRYIASYLEDVDEHERQDVEDGLRRRVEAVKASFFDEHLRRRYALKKTSKAPAFAAVEWDIKTKIADDSMVDLEPFPYATCRISYQTRFDEAFWSVLGGPFDSAQINFTVDEVRYLIRVLGAIEVRLESAERDGAL